MSISIGGKTLEIEYFNFTSAPKVLISEWKSAISKVIESGIFIGGPVVSKFESEWSQYLGIEYTVGVGNGYDALLIALKSLDIGPGDFVAVPNHTFVATWLAVDAVGAVPVGIDCDSRGLMDLSLLEGEKVEFKAVIPVHIHGQMVDMQRLMDWARKHNVKVIEDCAQSHGAEIHSKKSGTWGDIGVFSFYPTKNLGGLGDAGAIVTAHEYLAKRSRSISNYGAIPASKYKYQYLGVNSRMDPIQAAILSINIKYLDAWNAVRRNLAKKYSDGLMDLGIKPFSASSESIFHHYIVFSENRDLSKTLLLSQGIKTETHYPKSAQNNYSRLKSPTLVERKSNAETFAEKTLSLPLTQWMSEKEIYYVLSQISSERTRRSFLGEI
jgi:dTDP-4-amino-4,6-dideoxygalactose transaminase